MSPRRPRAELSKFDEQPTSTAVASVAALTMSVHTHVQALRVPSKIPSAKLGSHSPIPYPSSDPPLRRYCAPTDRLFASFECVRCYALRHTDSVALAYTAFFPGRSRTRPSACHPSLAANAQSLPHQTSCPTVCGSSIRKSAIGYARATHNPSAQSPFGEAIWGKRPRRSLRRPPGAQCRMAPTATSRSALKRLMAPPLP